MWLGSDLPAAFALIASRKTPRCDLEIEMVRISSSEANSSSSEGGNGTAFPGESAKMLPHVKNVSVARHGYVANGRWNQRSSRELASDVRKNPGAIARSNASHLGNSSRSRATNEALAKRSLDRNTATRICPSSGSRFRTYGSRRSISSVRNLGSVKST